MSKIPNLSALAAAALLACGGAHAASFSFTGVTDSGPLSGASFGGLFSYDDSALPANGDVLLDTFSMTFAGQSYALASTTGIASAVFAGGSFVGLSILDLSAADPGVRPNYSFAPGFFAFNESYFAYEAANAMGGFGSYTVSAVPEPWSAALLLAGLLVVGRRARRQG